MTGTALVTGATGFLGGHLALRLAADGWRVSALQRAASARSAGADRLRAAGVEVLSFDSGEEVQRLAREARPDVAFHLATHYLKSHTPEDVPLLMDANIAFGTHLLEGLQGSDTSVVSAMSFFQFREGLPTPMSLYSATKQAFFDVCNYYRVRAGLDITQVVLYDTFGPGDTRDKLVPNLLSALAERRPMQLGPSAQPINLLYVDDVVSGLIAAAEQREAPALTLRAPQHVSVGELVRVLGEVTGVSVESTFNEEGTVNEAVLHAGDWDTPAGWIPSTTLRDGLAQTWRSATGA